MNKIICWVEDESEELIEFTELVNILKLKYDFELIKFSNYAKFLEKLIEWKKSNYDKLNNLICVFDVMILGEYNIMIPESWHGLKGSAIQFHADKGYKAGFVFYEKALLEYGRHNFEKFPPVLYLTNLKKDSQIVDDYYPKILNKFREVFSNTFPEPKFVSKWDLDAKEKLEEFLEGYLK